MGLELSGMRGLPPWEFTVAKARHVLAAGAFFQLVAISGVLLYLLTDEIGYYLNFAGPKRSVK